MKLLRLTMCVCVTVCSVMRKFDEIKSNQIAGELMLFCWCVVFCRGCCWCAAWVYWIYHSLNSFFFTSDEQQKRGIPRQCYFDLHTLDLSKKTEIQVSTKNAKMLLVFADKFAGDVHNYAIQLTEWMLLFYIRLCTITVEYDITRLY